MSSNLMNIQFALALEADDTSQKMLDYLVNPESHSDAISSAIATNLSKSLVSILEGDKIKQVVIDALSIVDKAVKDVKDDTDETKVVSKSIIVEIKDLQYVIDNKISMLNNTLTKLDIPDANPIHHVMQAQKFLTDQNYATGQVTALTGKFKSTGAAGKALGVPTMDPATAAEEFLTRNAQSMLSMAARQDWDGIVKLTALASSGKSTGFADELNRWSDNMSEAEHKQTASLLGAAPGTDIFSAGSSSDGMISANKNMTGALQWKTMQAGLFGGNKSLDISADMIKKLAGNANYKPTLQEILGDKKIGDISIVGGEGGDLIPKRIADVLIQSIAASDPDKMVKDLMIGMGSPRPDLALIFEKVIGKSDIEVGQSLTDKLGIPPSDLRDIMVEAIQNDAFKGVLLSETGRGMNDRKAREDAARFASFGDTVSTRLISLGESKSNNPNITTIATKVPDMLDVMQTITTVNKMLKNINSTSFQTMRDQLSNYPASELSNDTTLAAAIDQMLPILDGILSRIKSNDNKIPTEGEEKQ